MDRRTEFNEKLFFITDAFEKGVLDSEEVVTKYDALLDEYGFGSKAVRFETDSEYRLVVRYEIYEA